MDEKRRNEIAYQVEKLNFRKNFTFRDFGQIKRKIGNLNIEEPELIEKNITKVELLLYTKCLAREFFEGQINRLM